MSSSSEVSDDDGNQRSEIREELSSMSFEEIMKLKEELGSKVYKEAVLGVDDNGRKQKADKKSSADFKRLNKNRPRELSAKRQVPFLGVEMRTQRKKDESQLCDPRFEESCGTYDVNKFKENYKFLSKIRQKEVGHLRKKLDEKDTGEDERHKIKQAMQRLINKNVEDRSWHTKQAMLKQEQRDIQKAHDEGKRPHYTTKKERRAKELVMKFEQLKKTGQLNKHLEKRRKKNTAKDRKKFSFD